MVGMTVMVLVPLLPCTMVRLLGEADKEKSGCGAALTVRLMVVVFVSVPSVPVMVTVAGPVVAELLAVNVSVLLVALLVGLNDAVTPVGRPEAEKLTVLL